MKQILKRIETTLQKRRGEDKLRSLPHFPDLIDFFSNDYLGLSRSKLEIPSDTSQLNGATGSRLISGNHDAYTKAEGQIAAAHSSRNALIFPTGYMANLGVLSTIPQRGDVILYDELCHASIRDGIALSNARAFKFRHNDTEDLRAKLDQYKDDTVFVVTESVFSMDGDTAPLKEMSDLCEENRAAMIVDEAHALGVFGYGLVSELGLQEKVLLTVVTFSKAIGLHGGAAIGSQPVIDYLVNHSRPFIYTTGLPPETVLKIGRAYDLLETHGEDLRNSLRHNIALFKSLIDPSLKDRMLPSETPIQGIVLGDNRTARNVESGLLERGIAAKAILHPTVPAGTERIRISIHSFNTEAEIALLCRSLPEIIRT